ncbi:glycosyl transferase family 90-domain-containing protein [Mycena metata]|uniref:Glycosyl transferase family 90-domain-containing protein n=1 Tax=Mycena metata TaxID=1033252 RepID=A0AAD7HTU9_9AGAR|nr:glycosyl transferase family 90-domain-containing protein [Mycena metata]
MDTVKHIFRGVDDSTIPLMPVHEFTHGSRDPEEDSSPYYTAFSGRHGRQSLRRRCLVVLTAALVVASTILVLILRARPPAVPSSSTNDTTTTLRDPDDAASRARLDVDALLAAQSSTLPEASARYTLRNQRATPPHYDRWFKFAQEKKCLVDNYDQIRRVQPFYHWQLAERDPQEYFRAMIERASTHLDAHPAEIAVVEIKDGNAYLKGETAYGSSWPGTLGRFSQFLPNMTFLLNGRDEPSRGLQLSRTQRLNDRALAKRFQALHFSPRPTVEFFQHQSGCIIPKAADGFVESANDASGFLLATAKPGFSTDFYPMLSMSKISPCFSDILFPIEYPYTRSWWYGRYAYPDDIGWEDKISKVYWRGMSNGGMIIGQNYHLFARFKLVDICPEHPDLMDVAITRFAETLLRRGPREDLYKYKYAMNVDGTTFSGRFLGLLRSGSLVFKSTLFEEYFNDWLRPFEHYIPVKADLSDLVQQIRWANDNPAEARLIQQRGMEVAKRVVTDDQNDCYFSLLC